MRFRYALIMRGQADFDPLFRFRCGLLEISPYTLVLRTTEGLFPPAPLCCSYCLSQPPLATDPLSIANMPRPRSLARDPWPRASPLTVVGLPINVHGTQVLQIRSSLI